MVWVLLLGHLLADFVLQTNKMNEARKEAPWKGTATHVFVHLIVQTIGVYLYSIWMKLPLEDIGFKLVLLLIIIHLSHFLIDHAKGFFQKKTERTTGKLLLFLGDQFAHIAIIFLTINLLHITPESDLLYWFWLLEDGNPIIKAIVIVSIVIIATKGAGYFLGIALSDMLNQPINHGEFCVEDEKTVTQTTFDETGKATTQITTTKTEQFYKDSPKLTGHYIGLLERAMIILLIVIDLPHGLAFLAAVKSLTRFKQFENKAFSEYYLVGTLASATIGILLGILTRVVLQY